MPTNIKAFQNKSNRSQIAFNSENVGNSFLAPGNTVTKTEPGLWISWHEEKPLVLATSKGFCHVWEVDWKVYGQWEGSSNKIILLEGKDRGVGGDVEVEIASDGDVTMMKAK